MILQQLLDHPKVVALGECRLDRTINPSQWCRQEEVFVRLLKLCRIEQPLVLHLSGTKGDLYSSDVHGRCLLLMEDVCDPLQKIHVHCFMGRSDVVKTWLRKFPKTYFGVTAAVRAFDQKQLEGLQAMPLNKALTGDGCALFPFKRCHGEYSGLPGRSCSIPVGSFKYASSRADENNCRKCKEALRIDRLI